MKYKNVHHRNQMDSVNSFKMGYTFKPDDAFSTDELADILRRHHRTSRNPGMMNFVQVVNDTIVVYTDPTVSDHVCEREAGEFFTEIGRAFATTALYPWNHPIAKSQGGHAIDPIDTSVVPSPPALAWIETPCYFDSEGNPLQTPKPKWIPLHPPKLQRCDDLYYEDFHGNMAVLSLENENKIPPPGRLQRVPADSEIFPEWDLTTAVPTLQAEARIAPSQATERGGAESKISPALREWIEEYTRELEEARIAPTQATERGGSEPKISPALCEWVEEYTRELEEAQRPW